MAEVHLDHPGEITWFKGYGPAEVLGPCPHNCPHDAIANIAWGPDYDHYTLNRCIVVEGCNGTCRAWVGEYPVVYDSDQPYKPGLKFGAWLHVHSAASQRPTEPDSDGGSRNTPVVAP